MNNKNSEQGKAIPLILFGVMCAVLIVFCFIMKNMDGDKTSENPVVGNVTEVSVADTVSDTAPETEKTVAETTEEPHVSPKKLEGTEMNSEISDLGIVLNKSKTKTCKLPLKDIAETCDIIDSVTFYFHAEDGVSYLGEVKGGFGITVDNACEAKTDNKWYQTPEDFSVSADGSAGSVVWQIPDEIKEYINVSNGELLFGYWWSNVDEIVLDRVVCHRKTIKEIPVDGEKTLQSEAVIKTAENENVYTVPLSELYASDQEPQCIEITFESDQPLTEVYGCFGVDTETYNDGHYTGIGVSAASEENTVSIKWLLPDVVKRNADRDGNLEFTLLRCSQPEITVKEIKTVYSIK